MTDGLSEAGRPRNAEAELDVKAWLRTCVLAAGVSTPMQFLFAAYRLQAGRRTSAEFADAIVRGCPGIAVRRKRGRAVVDGVAPSWNEASLTRAIQERAR